MDRDEASDDLHWQIRYNLNQVRELELVVRSLRMTFAVRMVIVLVLGFVLVVGAVWHFQEGYRPAGEDYQALIGAASIFGFFFFYESAAATTAVYSRYHRGRHLIEAQKNALSDAEDALTLEGPVPHGA